MSKTIAVFGAGSGLGYSVAKKFGNEGYKVALVSRQATKLQKMVEDLSTQGVEAIPFAADLALTDEISSLIEGITDRLGTIEVIEYAPISATPFIPAVEMDLPTTKELTRLLFLTPLEIVRQVLPTMIENGNGGILMALGVSAMHPTPHLSGPGPVMAALRNWVTSLNGEIADQGIYAGMIAIGAMIEGSALHKQFTAGNGESELPADTNIPMISPEVLANKLWDLYTIREQVEAIMPGQAPL